MKIEFKPEDSQGNYVSIYSTPNPLPIKCMNTLWDIFEGFKKSAYYRSNDNFLVCFDRGLDDELFTVSVMYSPANPYFWRRLQAYIDTRTETPL